MLRLTRFAFMKIFIVYLLSNILGGVFFRVMEDDGRGIREGEQMVGKARDDSDSHAGAV